MTKLEELKAVWKAAEADAYAAWDAAWDAAYADAAYAAWDAAYAAFVVALDAYVSELNKQENTND